MSDHDDEVARLADAAWRCTPRMSIGRMSWSDLSPLGRAQRANELRPPALEYYWHIRHRPNVTLPGGWGDAYHFFRAYEGPEMWPYPREES